ncbi:hypothetical protein JCM18237_15710 [Halorubrum luteum]
MYLKKAFTIRPLIYPNRVDMAGMGVMIPDAETLDIYVELELELPRTHPCAMRRLCSCANVLDSVSRHTDGGRCSLTIEGAPANEDEARIEQTQQPCHERECFYERLDRDGFSADVTEVTERGVRIEAYARSRELLADIVDGLSEIGTVTVHKLGETRPQSEFSDLRTVDFGTLTPLERETLRRAVEVGYYDEPRRTSLATLADEFDVSKGTLSQRLRSAERKLVLGATRVSSAGDI